LIIVVGTDDKEYRLSLQDGDTILYSDTDNFIKLKGDGGIDIEASSHVDVNVSGNVTINAENITAVANSIKLGDNTGLNKLVTDIALELIENHIHTINVQGSIDPSAMLIGLSTNPANKTQIVEAK